MTMCWKIYEHTWSLLSLSICNYIRRVQFISKSKRRLGIASDSFSAHPSFPQSRNDVRDGENSGEDRVPAAFLNKRWNLILSLCLVFLRSRGIRQTMGARARALEYEQKRNASEKKKDQEEERDEKRRDRVDDFPAVFVRPPRDISRAGV